MQGLCKNFWETYEGYTLIRTDGGWMSAGHAWRLCDAQFMHSYFSSQVAVVSRGKEVKGGENQGHNSIGIVKLNDEFYS